MHRHIYATFARDTIPGGRAVVGPGDDCAVVRSLASDGPEILVTVDQVIEGRHFTGPLRSGHNGPGTTIDLVARKLIARSVSDIAAMAGTPTWAVATGALPAGFNQAMATELFAAMARRARHWGCPLVGGDIATYCRTDTPLTLTATVAGIPHPRRAAVLRSGARIGDNVYVTGKIGNSFASGRHLTFEPRVIEARWLADVLGDSLHAMIDVSDGLGMDAGRVALASGAAIALDAAAIPLHEIAQSWQTAIADGEDYELVFTCDAAAQVPPHCPHTGTAITRIGTVVRITDTSPAGSVVVRDQDTTGAPTVYNVADAGWDHGRSDRVR